MNKIFIQSITNKKKQNEDENKLEENRNKSAAGKNKKEYNQDSNQTSDKASTVLNAKTINSKKETESPEFNITSKQLQEAIIWSEILGKPLCKRRKSR